MVIPKINSAHDSDTRNIINRAIDLINVQGKSIQDLVAKGQLTPEEYARLISIVNSNLKSGGVTMYDLDKNNFNFDGTWFSSDFLRELKDGEINTTNVLPESITRNELAAKSVTPSKTSFINISGNLIDENIAESGKRVNSDGKFEVFSSNLSAFIPIKPNTTYSFFGVDSVAYYTASEDFVSYSTVYSSSRPVQKRSPFNIAYMRVNIYQSAIGSVIVNEGESIIPYEPYYRRLMNIDIDGESALKANSIGGYKLTNHTVTPQKTSFIEMPDNLIDKSKLLRGHTIDQATGEPLANSSVHLTDFIEVEPNEMYSVYAEPDARVGLYDKNKEYISNVYLAVGEPQKFQTTSNTVFVRVVMLDAVLNKAQLNKGGTLLPYSEYHPPKLSDEIDVSGGQSNGAYNTMTSDFYVDDISFNDIYSAPEIPVKHLSTFPHTEVYALYDNLMAKHPGYIKRTFLGNEPTGKPIYRYDFEPDKAGNADPETIFKKVFITTGTHGHERVSIWNTFHAMEQIAENWQGNDTLESLRWNVHFIVIPVVNPWGLDWMAEDKQSSGTRKNSNGVDINRNMPSNWGIFVDPGASTYGGNEPLSEVETQYVYDVMENEKDIILFVDYHNFASSAEYPYFIWHPGTAFANNIAKSMISKLDRKWKSELSIFPSDDDMVGYADGMVGATLADQAAALGIHGATFETSVDFYPEENSPNYSALTFKLGVEALINHIAVQLKNLIPLENNKRIK